MKIRPVWRIHIAAYLFSGIVLGISAFGHHEEFVLQRYTGTAGYGLLVADQKLCLWSASPWPFERRLDVRVGNRLSYLIPKSWTDVAQTEQSHLLGMSFSMQKFPNAVHPCVVRSVILPLHYLLVIPTLWMAGFQMYRFYRNSRTSRFASRVPPDMPSAVGPTPHTDSTVSGAT